MDSHSPEQGMDSLYSESGQPHKTYVPHGVNDELVRNPVTGVPEGDRLHLEYSTSNIIDPNQLTDITFAKFVQAEASAEAREAENAFSRALSSGRYSHDQLDVLADLAATAREAERAALTENINVAWRIRSAELPQKIKLYGESSGFASYENKLIKDGVTRVVDGRQVHYSAVFSGILYYDKSPTRDFTPEHLVVVRSDEAIKRANPCEQDYRIFLRSFSGLLFEVGHKSQTTVMRTMTPDPCQTVDTMWFRMANGVDTSRLDLRRELLEGVMNTYDDHGDNVGTGWLIVDREFQERQTMAKQNRLAATIGAKAVA